MIFKLISLVLLSVLASCESLGKPSYPAPADPGWRRSAPDSYSLPAVTAWDGKNLVFVLPAEQAWTSAQVLSPRWQAPLELEKRDGSFSGAVEMPDTSGSVLLYLEEKRYLVMLPPGYFSEKEGKFPVMYWHDGQNMPQGSKSPFGGWKADTALATLVKSGEVQRIIQVGIFNTPDRMSENTGWAWPVSEDLQDTFRITVAQRDRSLGLVGQILNTIIPEVEKISAPTITKRPGKTVSRDAEVPVPQIFGIS